MDGGIIAQHCLHPEPKFLGPDDRPCGRETRGFLHRRHVEIGKKIPIRKEGNSRWQEGNDATMLDNFESEQPDATATEYERAKGKGKHKTHAVASAELREWLGQVPLDLISYHKGIDRHTLRSIRNGKPARREALTKLEELKKLWMHAERCNGLEQAVNAIRRSRHEYSDHRGLREFMKWA